ncbi:MAG: hypothetical protein R3242_08485 [Akkermansiaceae bacterium]|nr:hypothetical protein [Akkermansiaceae bacterium]
MTLAAIPQISLGTAAVLIFAGCLTYVLLRGVGRLMVGTAMVAASVFLGYLTWLKSPEISIAVFNKSIGFITTGLPILVFVGSFILIRIALKWIANPFGSKKETPMKDRRGMSKMRFLSLLGFALVPTLMVMMILAAILHHQASVHDVRQQADPEGNPDKTYAQQLKGSIERIIPERLLAFIDPYAEQSRLALAKWLARQEKESKLEPAVDPETGKVIPRAIIVEDAELKRLARERKFGTLLRHPALTKALDDPEVRKLVDDLR